MESIQRRMATRSAEGTISIDMVLAISPVVTIDLTVKERR